MSFVILCAPVNAQLDELAINPLQLEVGSRPLGMGGAFAGLADDMYSAFHNPAGLAWSKGISLSLRDSANLIAIQAYPTGYGSSLGLGVVTTQLSDISVPLGRAHSNSSVLSLSFGTKLTFLPALYKRPAFQRLGFGISIKSLMGQTLRKPRELDRSANGWDLDLGVLWKGEDWWTLGASLQNVLPARTWDGGVIRWNTGEEEGIPAVGKLAASARVIGDIDAPVFMEGRELLLGGEVDVYRSRPTLLRLGGEWNFGKTYYFRAGFMQQHKRVGISSDVNFGLGMRMERWGLDLVAHREPILDQRVLYFSFLYFPKDWIVVKNLEMEKPSVMIEKPIEALSLEDNIVTYDDRIEVFGRVKPRVDVYINGLSAALAPDRSFKVMVPLHLGKNLIYVEARYEGERKLWKYKVLRKAKVKIADAEKVKDLAEKKEAVESLVTMGVIEISPEAEFVMEAGVSRGELSSWLVKAADLKIPEVKEDVFPDVPRDHPLAPYIKVVADMKLFNLFPDGTFRPQAVVSKAEGDAIFARFGVTR